MAKSGIDVSQWQGKINWQKVKNAGVQFALLRAGYGDALTYPGQVDSTFEYNYSQCKRVGMPIGIYWYSYAVTVEAAVQEAKSCIALLKGRQFEYPIFYDVEEAGIFKIGKTNDIVKAFCNEMEKAGFWVGIYTYRSAAQIYFNDAIKNRYSMAIAEYGNKLNYSGAYGIWQNSSTWKVDGINGNVDHDWCYTDYPKRIREKGKNGFPKPADSNRVKTTQDTDILQGTADKPPIIARVGKGNQYTIEKTVKIGSVTFGKIKGTDNRWLDMGKVKKV